MRACMTVLAAFAAQAQASHPFVGAAKDESAVLREDGSVAMKLTGRKNSGYNKFGKMHDTSASFEPEKSTWDMLKSAVLGESEQETQFKSDLTKFHHDRKRKAYGKGRLGDDHVTSLLATVDGTIWTGEIYMARKSKLDVVFDTGSDWLTLEGVDCDNCEGNTYDPDTSLYSRQLTTESTERIYGTAYLIGNEYEDLVCVLLSTCINDFQYFLIESQQGLREPIDGILGMSRDLRHIYDDGTNDIGPYGPLILNYMQNQGIIDERKFSFYFTGKSSSLLSFVDFGSPQPQNMKNPDQIEYIKVQDDFFWSAFNQGIAIGTTETYNTFSYQAVNDYAEYVTDNTLYSILDTGSSTLGISALYFEDLIKKIFEYMGENTYSAQQGIIASSCSFEYPPLYFLFSNKWIRVNPSDYVHQVDPDNSPDLCILLITPLNAPMNVLGMPLFIDYYTVHDMEQGTIGFAPHSTSSKFQLLSGSKPSNIILSSQATATTSTSGATGSLQSLSNVWVQVICGALITGIIMLYRFFIYPELEPWGVEDWIKILISTVIFLAVVVICSFVIVPYIGPLLTGEASLPTVTPVEDGSTFLRVGANASSGQIMLVYVAAFAGVCFLMYKFAACCASRGASRAQGQKTRDQAIDELVQHLQNANQIN